MTTKNRRTATRESAAAHEPSGPLSRAIAESLGITARTPSQPKTITPLTPWSSDEGRERRWSTSGSPAGYGRRRTAKGRRGASREATGRRSSWPCPTRTARHVHRAPAPVARSRQRASATGSGARALSGRRAGLRAAGLVAAGALADPAQGWDGARAVGRANVLGGLAGAVATAVTLAALASRQATLTRRRLVSCSLSARRRR